MKKTKRKGHRILVIIALTVLLLQFITPSELWSERWTKADCDAALIKCGFASILTLIGNPVIGTAIGALCTLGYLWCMQFAR